MWALPSGTFVEAVLYDKLHDASHESLGHSFVIDVFDPNVERLFDPCDWEAILRKVPEWPENDRLLGESMKKFHQVG